jgi:hypothetical protein
MEPFTKALEIVAEIMRDGAATHPDNDIRRGPEYHPARQRRKCSSARPCRTMCPTTRLLMALTLHELE